MLHLPLDCSDRRIWAPEIPPGAAFDLHLLLEDTGFDFFRRADSGVCHRAVAADLLHDLTVPLPIARKCVSRINSAASKRA